MSGLGDLCNCRAVCGDVDDEYGTCKGLRRPPSPPLVEVVLVPRRPTPALWEHVPGLGWRNMMPRADGSLDLTVYGSEEER